MKANGRIDGIVRNEYERPLADCSVVILSGPTHNDISPVSDSLGKFSLSDLIPGNYTLQVYSSFSNTDRIGVQVRQNRISKVEVWFETGKANNNQNGESDFIDEV
jgi:Carboxypeptidase regulatory-like domain